MSERPQFIKKADLWIISGLLVAAFALWAFFAVDSGKQNDRYAEIYHDGHMVKTIYLYESQVFSVDGLPQVVFEVRDGSVAFVRSDCPDRICVHTGRLKHPGQFAACLPNRVTLFVKGTENDGGVDVVAK